MNISRINSNQLPVSKNNFKHASDAQESSYSAKNKLIVAGTSALGVAIAMAGLAKHAGYSLKPSKIFKHFKSWDDFKNSYFMKVRFEAEQVISIGAGTCLGGLLGGYAIDQDPANRKAKTREAVMQMGNISIPILTVAGLAGWTEKYGKVVNSFASLGAVFVGVYLANILMNKLGDLLFNNKQQTRGVKATDFSAHLDDFVLASSYIFPKQTAANGAKTFSHVMGNVVHSLGRLVPAALVIPGYEIGKKEACHRN